MKTASVRELRQQFARIQEWLKEGEEVEITRRREPIARLISVRRKRTARQPMPDIAVRLKKVFESRVIRDRQMEFLLKQNRRKF